MELKYQVTADGQVVNVATAEGHRIQKVKVEKATELPWPMSRGGSRFEDLKRLVCHQEPGFWYVYGEFESLKEAEMAQAAVNRHNKDKLLKRYLNGKKVETTVDKESNRLGVRVTIKANGV